MNRILKPNSFVYPSVFDILGVSSAGYPETVNRFSVTYPLLLKHGKPELIRSDNGPEFASKGFQA